MIILTSELKLKKSIIYQLIVTDKLVLGAIYSTCLVYTTTIIHLAIGKKGGYLPSSEAIHLHLSE